MSRLAVTAVAIALACAAPERAAAQGASTIASQALRDGNAAATAGDWVAVSRLVDPLAMRPELLPTERAEAHRLAGLAAFFQERRAYAEAQFLAYLRLDLDGQLDPALYPPEVILFFNEVKARHGAELRARRPKARRLWYVSPVPVLAQLQNGQRTKAIVLGSLAGGFAVANLTSYLLLDAWCTRVQGDTGGSATCDDGEDRAGIAGQLRVVNIVSGVGLIAALAYGVYDGVAGYRRVGRRERLMQPYVAAGADRDAIVGIRGAF